MPYTSRYIIAGTLLSAVFSLPVHAGIGGVGGATVNEGQLTTQLRVSLSDDDESDSLDGRVRTRFGVDYGVTDDLALGLFIQGDARGNDNHELDAFLAEARYEITDAPTSGYYSGIRFRYTYKDGDKKPDNAHLRFVLGAPVGKWDFRLNQFIAYRVGEDSRGGIGLATRSQVSYGYHQDHRIGLESLNDFGFGSERTGFSEQSHIIGPFASGKLVDKLSYAVGYRHGLSKAAADHTVKLYLTRKF